MSNNRPSFNVPAGAVAKVSIIDSTVRLAGLKVDYLCKPEVDGFEEFKAMPSWSFLVENSSGKKALFDLGVRVDLSKLVPRIQKNLEKYGWKPGTKENVADNIKRHGVDPQEIGSVIWSHFHWDHTGDISAFPSTTELVVGPGFKEAAMPGYPAQEDAPVTEADLSGREVREISFSRSDTKAGDFPAHDFFGDGSFYLLNTPGHCIGHISGLARTSKAGEGSDSDTFIFLGGDLAHHGGELRPSRHLPVPDRLPSVLGGKSGSDFRAWNVTRGRRPDQSFLDSKLFVDEAQSGQTIARTQVADADPNVWFVFAHDTALLEGVDLFPGQANAWKQKGYKEKTLWHFLQDFVPAICK